MTHLSSYRPVVARFSKPMLFQRFCTMYEWVFLSLDQPLIVVRWQKLLETVFGVLLELHKNRPTFSNVDYISGFLKMWLIFSDGVVDPSSERSSRGGTHSTRPACDIIHVLPIPYASAYNMNPANPSGYYHLLPTRMHQQINTAHFLFFQTSRVSFLTQRSPCGWADVRVYSKGKSI